MTYEYPDLGSASSWLKEICYAARPIRSTIQVWVLVVIPSSEWTFCALSERVCYIIERRLTIHANVLLRIRGFFNTKHSMWSSILKKSLSKLEGRIVRSNLKFTPSSSLDLGLRVLVQVQCACFGLWYD